MRADRRALYRRNRRIIAERCRWPAGTLEICEGLERQHPAWHVSWLAANDVTGWRRPAGFCATRDDVNLPGGDTLRRGPDDGVARNPFVFGATVGDLLREMAAMEARIAELEERDRRMTAWMRSRPD